MRPKLILSLLTLILVVSSYDTDASYGLRLEYCFLEEIGEEALCGTYEVMENPNVRKGARIRLNFIILPARTSNPAPDPVFIFSGGPGVGSADWAAGYAEDYQDLRWERDLVLVDQRGTGDSNPLHCRRLGDQDSAQTFLQDMFPEDYVRECRKELEKRARLYYYDSFTAMQDIDDLRDALGYETINVVGNSYGAYAGIVYMKYFPERVRCASLGYIGMPDWGYHATIAPYTEAALERLLSDCAADPDSAADYPDLRQKLTQVTGRLKQGHVTVPIINPLNAQPETVTFSHNNFIHGVRSMLYGTSRSRWIPAFIHWAAGGHFAPVVEYTANYLRWINEDIMDGMFLSVTCTETAPYIDYEAARAAAEGTFMGTYRLDQQQEACELWVRGDHPADFHQMPILDIPTLIFSGELDPVTPPRIGDRLAGYLPHSQHVVLPNTGHGAGYYLWEECLADVVARFISQGHPGGLDTSCADSTQRPPFVSWRDYEGEDSDAIRAVTSGLGESRGTAGRAPRSRRR
jgi:pimeloyl-ACP methyl ester carboxylesterase